MSALTPTSTASSPTPETFTPVYHWIGVSDGPLSARQGISATTQFFPLRKRHIIIAPLYEFTITPPGTRLYPFPSNLTGVVQMALARPVSSISKPDLPDETPANAWVVIAPDDTQQIISTWQEGASNEPENNMTGSWVLERDVQQTLTFANNPASLQTSLQSLITALATQGDPSTAAGLWVDVLLVEETDAQGDKSWVLYEFALPPDPPAGADKDFTYCCRWLRCGVATGKWAFKCRLQGCAGLCTTP